LIAKSQVERDERFPERQVYAVTELGRAVALDWMRDMLSQPQQEFPEFPVAICFLPLLTVEETIPLLETRLASLRDRGAAMEAAQAQFGPVLPRLFLLENEYLLAIANAEINWVAGVVDDLRSGRLGWEIENLKKIAEHLEGSPPDG
jgi:hypothetical protein